MYTQNFLELLKKAEKEFVFDKFDLSDAYSLGTKLYETGQSQPKPIAVRIVVDGLIVYQAFMPGTTENNNNWINRKYAAIERTHKSSLRVAVERELFGVKENWQSDEVHYAFCGGGFPITVDDNFCGAVIISGLPHLQDNQLLVNTIAEYLGKTPIDFTIE